MKMFDFQFQRMKFVPKGPIGNKSALVQVMAWHLTGDNPLPQPMMTQFNDTYMHPLASMSLLDLRDCFSVSTNYFSTLEHIHMSDSHWKITCILWPISWVVICRCGLSRKREYWTFFVKLEELHIATARKPLFHQTQPVAWYQHRNQPCML